MPDVNELLKEILSVAKEGAGKFWEEQDKDFWTARLKEYAELQAKKLIASDVEKLELNQELQHVIAQIAGLRAQAALKASQEAQQIVQGIVKVIGKVLAFI